jgi:tetratricopeptide (TPR) repeat protein
VLNVLPLELAGGPFVADRFLYWPSFLFLLALGSAAKEMKEWRLEIKSISKIQLPFSILYSLISIWLLGCAVVTLLLVPRWRSDVSFWEWAARQAPESPMPPTNLALEYAEAGRLDEALAQAERAIAMDPASATAWVNLGLTHFRAGRFGDAETAFARAVELKPGHALFWNDLAGALREQSRLAEAEAILVKEALPRDPYLAATHLNLGVVYLRTDRPDLAARHLQEALRLLPPAQAGEAADLLAQTREPTAWLRLGDGLLAHDDPRGALAAFEQAASLGAPAIDALVGRGAALITLRDWPAATATLQAALILAPQEPRLYNNLGVLARAQGNLAEARRYFTAAAKLAPTWELPRQNLQALGGQ